MRPLLLKMTSFGPYLNETIDFRRLKNKGIFLIAGETGSGKTTIFDAISVALYGESNGNERSAESFKSDFDNDENMMQIELTFELRGKTYKVNRRPKQKRRKKIGEGYTEDSGEVTLYEINNGNEIAIAFSKDVNSKISELLGINSKQFRQIVMIPQGQFRKLITESSEEREKILKSIFNVGIYEQFQKNIAIYNKELENALKEEGKIISTEVGHIKCEANTLLYSYIHANDLNIPLIIEETKHQNDEDKKQIEAIANSINSKKLLIQTLEQQMEVAKKINNQIEAYEEALKEKQSLDYLNEHYEKVNFKIECAERIFRIQPIYDGALSRSEDVKIQKELIKSKKEELKTLKENLDTANKEYLKLSDSSNLLKLNVNRENLVFLRSILPKVAGLDELNSKLIDLNKTYKKEEEQLENIKQSLGNNKESFDKRTQKKESFSKLPLEIEKAQNKLNDLEEKLELNKQLEQLRFQYIEAIEAHKKALDLYNEINDLRKQKQDYYEMQQRQWINGQAGILAKDLKEGEPCPVCGNTNHIKPAIISKDIPNQSTLDILKDELNKLEKNFNKKQMTLASEKQKRHNKKEQLKELLKKIDNIFKEKLSLERRAISDFCNKKNEELLKEYKSTKDLLGNLTKEYNKYDENNKELEKIVFNIKEEEGQLSKLQNVHLITLKEKTIKESEMKLISSEIPTELKYLTTLKSKINQQEQEIKNFEVKLEEGKIALENARRVHDHATGVLIETQNVLIEKEKAYETSINNFEQLLHEYGFSDKAEIEKYRLSEEALNKLKNELNDYRQRVHTNLSNLLMLSQEVKDLEKIDLTKQQLEKTTLEGIIEEITNNRIRLNLRVDENVNQIDKIDKIYYKIKGMIEKQSLVNDLCQVANGTVTGTQKITFERYILATFLQEVIDAANIRFHRMSNSRYELMRKDQSSDKRRHTGLDLEVFDYYTGKARDINTLSGGEGFKASLSLALGLADVAQAYAGGINLDTMFVDEGFGSLSSESLDYAINCLMDLKEGGRLVGVISHVQELKDRIDAKLIVEKQKTGSKTYLYI